MVAELCAAGWPLPLTGKGGGKAVAEVQLGPMALTLAGTLEDLQGAGRDQQMLSGLEGLAVMLPSRLALDDGENHRGVQNHAGRPSAS